MTDIEYLKLIKEEWLYVLALKKKEKILDVILKSKIIIGVITTNIITGLLQLNPMLSMGLNGCILVYLKEKYPTITQVNTSKSEILEIKEIIESIDEEIKQLSNQKENDIIDLSFAENADASVDTKAFNESYRDYEYYQNDDYQEEDKSNARQRRL